MKSDDTCQCQQGWETWYRRDAAALLIFMQRRSQRYLCLEHCEDLVQDCFMIGFRKVSSGHYVNQGSSLRAYLYGIAHHLLQETARSQRKATSLPQTEEAEVKAPVLELADWVCVNEVLTQLRAACGQQPQLNQSVVASLYGDGKSSDAIAQELRISAGNVRIIAHRSITEITRNLACRGHRLSTTAVRSCLQALSYVEV
jgi:RNA polymerase sigma factor (sigma-70 family)